MGCLTHDSPMPRNLSWRKRHGTEHSSRTLWNNQPVKSQLRPQSNLSHQQEGTRCKRRNFDQTFRWFHRSTACWIHRVNFHLDKADSERQESSVVRLRLHRGFPHRHYIHRRKKETRCPHPRSLATLGSHAQNPRLHGVDTNRLFRNINPFLNAAVDDPRRQELEKRAKLLGKSIQDIFNDFVKELMKCLIPKLRRLPGEYDSHEKELVLAVPPGRTLTDYDAICEAFIHDSISSNKVFFVTEPEAVFRSWVVQSLISTESRPSWKVWIVSSMGILW